MTRREFTAALMAGGKSSRMGSDKRLLEIDGIPFWQRQIELLESLAPSEILISASDYPAWAGRHGVVKDEAAGAGPLAGLSAILNAAAHEIVLVLAVDMPLMNARFCPIASPTRPPSSSRPPNVST